MAVTSPHPMGLYARMGRRRNGWGGKGTFMDLNSLILNEILWLALRSLLTVWGRNAFPQFCIQPETVSDSDPQVCANRRFGLLNEEYAWQRMTAVQATRCLA